MCQSEEGEPWDGRDQTIVLQVAVSFLQACAEGVSRICLRSGHLICSCCVTECSEMSVCKNQTPWNHPEGRIQHLGHGKSLKSRKDTYVNLLSLQIT